MQNVVMPSRQKPITRFFFPHEITKPGDVRRFLKHAHHWKTRHSAYELAHSWVSANDIPASVRDVLDTCPDYAGADLVEGLFERRVDLRTPGEPSHTDILAFVKSYCGYAVIAVEGKVAEPFDELVSAWNDSPGKAYRLERLCASLGLSVDAVGDIRYQLLHRTVSAIHEAQRYRTERAIMLVHSFSARDASFGDFQRFAAAMGIPVRSVNEVSGERECDGIRVRLAWVKDQPRGRVEGPDE